MYNEKEDLIPRVGKTYELRTFFSLLNIHDRTDNMGSDFRENRKFVQRLKASTYQNYRFLLLLCKVAVN